MIGHRASRTLAIKSGVRVHFLVRSTLPPASALRKAPTIAQRRGGLQGFILLLRCNVFLLFHAMPYRWQG